MEIFEAIAVPIAGRSSPRGPLLLGQRWGDLIHGQYGEQGFEGMGLRRRDRPACSAQTTCRSAFRWGGCGSSDGSCLCRARYRRASSADGATIRSRSFRSATLTACRRFIGCLSAIGVLSRGTGGDFAKGRNEGAQLLGTIVPRFRIATAVAWLGPEDGAWPIESRRWGPLTAERSRIADHTHCWGLHSMRAEKGVGHRAEPMSMSGPRP